MAPRRIPCITEIHLTTRIFFKTGPSIFGNFYACSVIFPLEQPESGCINVKSQSRLFIGYRMLPNEKETAWLFKIYRFWSFWKK